jgi:hypothetical protein
VVNFGTRQLGRQGFAPGLAFRLPGLAGVGLQLLELFAHRGQIRLGGFLEQLRLLGRQPLGTHPVALTLVERELMGEPLDLGLTPDEFALLLHEQAAQDVGIQLIEVGGKNHAWIMPDAAPSPYRGIRRWRPLRLFGWGLTEDAHDLREQRIHACAHVQGGGRQPQRIDADHASQSRSHAPHALAAWTGHSSLTLAAPLHFEADHRLDHRWELNLHETRLYRFGKLCSLSVAATRRLDAALAHPAPHLVCVQAVGQRHAGHRYPRLATGRDDRLFECLTVRAPASARDDDVHSVHHRNWWTRSSADYRATDR